MTVNLTIYAPGNHDDPIVVIGPRGERWYLGPYADDAAATAAATLLPSGLQNGYVYLNTTTGKTRVRKAGAWANNDADAQDAVTAAQLAETNAETAQAEAEAAQAEAEAARDDAFGYSNFRSTIAEGITDFAVGAYFTSTDDGSVTAYAGINRMYKRIAGSPYYEDQGDNAAPGNNRGSAQPTLPNWAKKRSNARTVVFWGNSHISNATAFFTELTFHQNSGEALSGATVYQYGNNGATIAAMLADSVTYGITAVIAAAPDLVYLPDATNDVRLGLNTQAQVEALLQSCISRIRVALPNCEFVLPNCYTFLTTDVGSAGYVVPNGSAQTYSTLMRNAVYNVAARNSIPVHDEALIGGTTALASSLYMGDQIHASSVGQGASALRLVRTLIGNGVPGEVPALDAITPPLSRAMCDFAIKQNIAQPWLVYPRVVEDTRYFTLIASGRGAVVQNQGYLDFVTAEQLAVPLANIHAGDICQIGSLGCFVLPNAVSPTAQSSTVTRLNGLGGSLPDRSATSASINIYRPKYGDSLFAYDPALESYLKDTTTYPYRRRVHLGGGSGANYVRLGATRGDPLDFDIFQTAFDTADLLIFPGYQVATKVAGGSGYAVNDTITLTSGAVVTVLTVSAGAVLTARMTTQPTSLPLAGEAQVSTSGSGTGATFTLTKTTYALGSVNALSLAGSYIQYAPTGDFTSRNGIGYAWVIGTGAKNRNATEEAGKVIEVTRDGALAATTKRHSVLSRGGTYKKVNANLGTASSDGTVTHILLIGGTEVVRNVWAQGASGTTATTTFNSAGNSARCTTTGFMARPGDVLTEQITFSAAGTGSADLSVAFDL